MKKIIKTNEAPSPIGPYSQAILSGNMLFISGQIPINSQTNQLVESGIEDETIQVMENVKAILLEAGFDFSNVIKTTIYLTDMKLFDKVNTIYARYFIENFPARETVAVAGLPKNVNVEISMVASN